MTKRLLKEMLAGLVLIWVTVGIHYGTCNNCLTRDTYPVVKDGKTITCWLCQPGTKFVADCPLNDTTAICTPCDIGTYNSCYNRSLICDECTHVCPSAFEHVPTCNTTHDNTCECQDGMYRKDSYTCLTHTVCQPGEQIQTLGTNYKNTECVPCPNGTFWTTGNSCQCQKCRVCTEHQYERSPCNGTRDAVCNDDRYGSYALGGFIGFSVACGLLSFMLVCLRVIDIFENRKRTSRQQQPAVQMVNADRDYDVVHDDMEGSTRFGREHSQNSSTRTQQYDTRTPLIEAVVNQSDASAVSAGNGTDMHTCTSDIEREGLTFETELCGKRPTPGTSREGGTSSDAGSNSNSDKLTQASGQGVDHLKNQVDQDASAKLRKQEVLRCRAEKCTDEMFLWLKDKIPIRKKMFIFCRLFGNKYAVEEQEHIHHRDIPQQVFNLLYKWRDELGRDATADKLVNALVEEGCEKVANELKINFELHEN